MTEQGSTVEESTALVTTTEVTQHATTGSDKTSSLSDGIGFYFQCAVVVIGVIGTAANALILYALVASKQHKKHILIVNINALDLLGCVSLVITYSVKLCNIRLTGTSGYWLCVMILSENFVWWGVTGSRISLAIITIDRYLKVVHSAWSKKKLRNWMIYSAMAFSWSSPLIYCVTMAFTTTAVINGVCYAAVMWDSQVAKMIHIIWNVTSFYVIIILIIIFCYWRILVVIRRQASAMATHSGPGPSTAQTQSHQMQTNVIKTMILVSAFYAITGFPTTVYYLLLNMGVNVSLHEGGYYASVFLLFLYSCTNPFIYAIKFDPVKHTLLGLIPCKKISVQPSQAT